MASNTASNRLTRQQSVYDSVSQWIPAGHEKQIKQALYTTAALALFVLVLGITACAYFVLQLFIKPLLWAVLCGSFLFPFKYTLQNVIETWLKQTLDSGIPLVINSCVIPFTLFSSLSDSLGSIISSRWKILSAFITGLVSLYVLHNFGLLTWILSTAVWSINCLLRCVYNAGQLVIRYDGIMVVLLTAYFSAAFYFQWKVSSTASLSMWLFSFLYLIGMSGSLQIPFVMLLFILFVLGYLKVGTTDALQRDNTSGQCSSREQEISSNSNANTYFNILFVIFAVVVIWLHMWILLLMLIPMTFWLCKKLVMHEKTSELLDTLCMKLCNKSMTASIHIAKDYWLIHKSVLFPEPLPNIISILRKGDRILHLGVMSSLPSVTSILIILLLFSNAIFMSVFLIAKVQKESFLVAQVTSNLINETVSQHPEYKTWLPDNETMQKSMNSFVDMVYVQGREWISQKVETTLGPNGNNTKVQKQVLMLWDQIYHDSFMKTSSPLLRRNSMNKTLSDSTGLFHGFLDLLNMSEVVSWLQENVSALMSLGETLLTVLQSNITLIISLFTSVFTTILTGGTMVLNFLISSVIFFTTLFYLLASSTNIYKPVEVVGSALRPLTMGAHIEKAVQDAVNGVFGASIKMFGFYGIYTWVNHCLFGSNLVYLPSILAAMFGVIPILTTYWVSIPSALEIWLLQGSLLRAIGLVVCQFLPTLFVDTAIYQDIAKTGGGAHPYVTGLSVAGGVYTFGLEGALAGPLILCFLLVAINLYTSATSDDADKKSE